MCGSVQGQPGDHRLPLCHECHPPGLVTWVGLQMHSPAVPRSVHTALRYGGGWSAAPLPCWAARVPHCHHLSTPNSPGRATGRSKAYLCFVFLWPSFLYQKRHSFFQGVSNLRVKGRVTKIGVAYKSVLSLC